MRVKRLLALISLGTAIAGITASADSGIVANCAPGIYSQDQIITLMDPSGRTIRYTTDGTDPTLTSKVYSGQIQLQGDTVLKVAAFDENNKPSDVDTLEYRTLPMRQDRVSAGNFIKTACSVAGLEPTIDAAIANGIIGPYQFRDYGAAITTDEAARICNAVYERLNGDSCSATKYKNVITYERIEDLADSDYQDALVKCYCRGIIVGDSLGTFSTSRRLMPAMPISLENAKLALKRLKDPSLRKIISADGQVTRNTDLPESYKEYKYVLESFPNSYYNKPQFYKSVGDEEASSPVEAGSGDLMSGVADDDKTTLDTATVMEWCKKIETALRLRFSIDYTTIGEDWVSDMMSVQYDGVYSPDSYREKLESYVNAVKSDGSRIQCNKVVCDPSSLYYCQGSYFARAYFSFNVISSKSSSKSGYVECILDGLYSRGTGETISGYVDVPLVSDGSADNMYVGIDSFYQIGNVIYNGEELNANAFVSLAKSTKEAS